MAGWRGFIPAPRRGEADCWLPEPGPGLYTEEGREANQCRWQSPARAIRQGHDQSVETLFVDALFVEVDDFLKIVTSRPTFLLLKYFFYFITKIILVVL